MSSFGNMFATRSENSDDNENLYNYVPTEWVCILFITLFAISTTLHIAQAVRYRLWWLFPTAVLSGITEILGWSGRLWSSQNPLLRTPFLIQATTLVMAPTYLIATNFMVLGKLIAGLGPAILPHVPKVVLQSCSLHVILLPSSCNQSVGELHQAPIPDLGGHISLGGIVLQLLALLFFAFIAGEFLLRFAYDRPIRHSHANNLRGVVDRNIGLMITGLSTMTILLLIRSIYRTVELSDGWTGTIISTQWLFNCV
ncbi:RTA1 like protein [Lactarius vividus]|nr:RTA1 like protein [Lactarius vividus]